MHVPSLSYRLFSLKIAADDGRTYTGKPDGVTEKFRTGETLFLRSEERLNFLYVCRPSVLFDDRPNNAVNAPGPEPNNRGTRVDMNAFQAVSSYAYEGDLHKMAKKMDVTLNVKLHECKCCFMANAIYLKTSYP